MEDNIIDFTEVTNNGERVTHLYPNTCYKAHLSIYHFALQYAVEKQVLDAGSGSGYGSHFLAENGADSVIGLELSETAVRFSQRYFYRENLHYKQMDLQQIQGFAPETFDFVFTSNVLEHLESVPQFLHNAHSLLKPDGVMLIAVPPITNEEARQANIDNPYHLNIWSPCQWHYVLSQYFAEIECFRHHIELPNYQLDFSDTAETSIPTVEDFQFLPISLETLSQLGALTAVFVVRKKLPQQTLPSADSSLKMVDASFTRSSFVGDALSGGFLQRLFKRYTLVRTFQWAIVRSGVVSFIKWNTGSS